MASARGRCSEHAVLDERATWAIGLFKNTNNIFGWNVGDGEYDVTSRLTGSPYYECDGRYLVHLGLGGSHRDLDDETARFRARTDIRNGPAALHTIIAEARMFGSGQDIIVPEIALVYGPFSLQSRVRRHLGLQRHHSNDAGRAAQRTAARPSSRVTTSRPCTS